MIVSTSVTATDNVCLVVPTFSYRLAEQMFPSKMPQQWLAVGGLTGRTTFSVKKSAVNYPLV